MLTALVSACFLSPTWSAGRGSRRDVMTLPLEAATVAVALAEALANLPAGTNRARLLGYGENELNFVCDIERGWEYPIAIVRRAGNGPTRFELELP